ncbi:MAG TPA: hypothetical protein VML54_00850, partial [Candidatus Limnocylindrales bacterium]|nr:hypothetical protein [Candidatus Limnocylindrales bacterium]
MGDTIRSDVAPFRLDRATSVHGKGREIDGALLTFEPLGHRLLDLRGTLWDCVAASFLPGSVVLTLSLRHQGDNRAITLGIDCLAGVAWEAEQETARGEPIEDLQRRLGPSADALGREGGDFLISGLRVVSVPQLWGLEPIDPSRRLQVVPSDGPAADRPEARIPAAGSPASQLLAALMTELDQRDWSRWLAHEIRVLETFV